MKKILLPILMLLVLFACKKDFDENNDTDQRWVDFSFDPSDYFSDILVATEQGFELGAANMLEPEYELRIVGYCFDADSILIAKNMVFGDMQRELALKFKHLDKNSQYHFLFLSDIVKRSSETDYYETWYQLTTQNLNSFYFISFAHDESAIHNTLLYALMDVSPSNQTLLVPMLPITYNGYCVFNNYEDSNKIKASALYYQSFYIHNMIGKDRVLNELIFHEENENSVIFPITASHADQSIGLQITTFTNGLNITTSLNIPNPERRPFVVTIDCNTHQITNLDLF